MIRISPSFSHCTRAGGSEKFGLVRVVFQKVFTQDDSVVVLVGEHRRMYKYIHICIYVYRIQSAANVHVLPSLVPYGTAMTTDMYCWTCTYHTCALTSCAASW